VGQGDARGRRRARDARHPAPRGRDRGPPPERAALRLAARHHEGAEEGDEGNPGRRPGHRRRAAPQDPEARDAAQAHGRPQGQVGPGARPGAAQRSEGDLSMGNALVVAEHLHGKFPKTTLVSVAAGKQAASLAGGKCLGAVLGQGIDALANELAEYGVDVVAVDGAPFAHYLADAYTAAIAEIVKQKDVEVVIAAATAVGKDLLPRVAARLGGGMASDVTAIVDARTFKRPMYAGNAIATIQIDGAPRVVSVRTTAFDAAAKDAQKGTVEKLAVTPDAAHARMQFVEFAETKSDRPVLTEARIVCSGGRGLKNGEYFTIYLEPLCDALGAAMGASRAAVDAGFVPNDLQ